ncbi:hypothetical protein [Profundibacter sp.]|uniref:hypothetical protein n=1 Tax=Profundibacter sp. TaxID=3101071 RepID=UPI003D0E6300
MNAIASVSRKETRKNNKSTTQVNETYWGYIVRCNTCDRTLAVVFQWGAAIVGGLLVLASLGFWALPGSVFTPELISFKMALVSLFGVFGVTLIWYASHGTKYEIQVDLAKLEIREVLRNTKGVARIQGRIPFEKIGSVFIDRTQKENGKVRLVMRLGNSAQVIEVARDKEENLTGLRDKMGRDLLGRNAPMRTKANRGYILEGAEGVIKPKAVA